MKQIYNFILIAILFGASFTQHSHAQPLDYPSQKEGQFIFMMSDKNRDGYLSWAEVHAADKTLTQAEFNMIDANKDRYITMQEYLGFISR